MIDVLDRGTLTELARHQGWPAISIQLTTHRAGPEIQQDPIRLKNLLRTAEEDLAKAGMRLPEIDALLRPARALLEDAAFWREGSDGLAVFLGEDSYRVFRLDIALPESVSVGERYAIRPVLPALNTGERFYVLALSKNHVRLLEGTRHEVHELDLTGVPASLSEALQHDEYERQVQFHSGTPASGGAGRRAAMFHGHGGLPDVEKNNLERYFRLIDRGLHEFLRDDHAPLILAGVDYLLPIYRAVNSYPHLVDVSMTGNPDETPAHALHAEARTMLEPHFRAERERDHRQLSELSGTPTVSEDLGEIVPAAHEGRVKVLFVSPHTAMYGTFDPSSSRVDVSDTPGSDDWDLAELAAAETLLHGGTIHAFDAEEPARAAAIFRY
ncbi:MAG: hypothetical protein U1E29_02995 [Coriobacteriia bacterium]|nr:hypothetical protein [Coriobacteriia bacterium]